MCGGTADHAVSSTFLSPQMGVEVWNSMDNMRFGDLRGRGQLAVLAAPVLQFPPSLKGFPSLCAEFGVRRTCLNT